MYLLEATTIDKFIINAIYVSCSYHLFHSQLLNSSIVVVVLNHFWCLSGSGCHSDGGRRAEHTKHKNRSRVARWILTHDLC